MSSAARCFSICMHDLIYSMQKAYIIMRQISNLSVDMNNTSILRFQPQGTAQNCHLRDSDNHCEAASITEVGKAQRKPREPFTLG